MDIEKFKKMRCPFNIGETVVCVNNEHSEKYLTNGKAYNITESSRSYQNLCIIADHGFSMIPGWDRFITQKENRRKKLNTIVRKGKTI